MSDTDQRVGSPAHRRRVAITGMGVVTPAGPDLATTMAAMREGSGTAAPVTRFDATSLPVGFACEVTDLDADDLLGAREARRIDRSGHLALIASAQAMADAGLDADALDRIGRDRVAVVAGSGVGGLTTLEEQVRLHSERGSERGPRRVSPMTVPMMMANAPAALVSIAHGLTGPSLCVSTACATGANAIGEGRRMVRDGTADVVVAGAAECAITPTAMAAFANMGALSRRSDDPAAASRPFAADRDGFVMGEGAGFVVLEEWDHAVARGARIHGELAGYGATSDAGHITAPDADAAGAIRCIRVALDDAGLAPGDIRHVNAHGTSTPLNDAAEAKAIATVFGGSPDRPAGPPVTSSKGVIGHLIGAAGAVEAAIALTSAGEGSVPPVGVTEAVDPALEIDLVVGSPRDVPVGPVLSTSFAFGGHNAALVLVPV